MDQPGAGGDDVGSILPVHGPGRFEDLIEQLPAGILCADLAQVRPEFDADAVETMAALTVDNRLGGEDRAAAPGVPFQAEDLYGVDVIAETTGPLVFRHEPLEQVTHLSGGVGPFRPRGPGCGRAGGRPPAH